MTVASDTGRTSSTVPGRFGRALLRMFMKHARVAEVETLGESFRLITLEISEFRELRWLPGQKVQIVMGSPLVARTFTPIDWDATEGIESSSQLVDQQRSSRSRHSEMDTTVDMFSSLVNAGLAAGNEAEERAGTFRAHHARNHRPGSGLCRSPNGER